jgi:hypothetical protein
MAPIDFLFAAPKFFGVVVPILIVAESAATRENQMRTTVGHWQSAVIRA